MKKLFLFGLILILPIKVLAISATSSIAMDLDTGRIYHQNNINEERLIASITKIMTAIVTIENADINKEITVKDDVLKAYGSAIYIEVGEKLLLKDLLYGLILRSGNDAAIVIADEVAGSMSNFAKLMNDLAKKIGMTNSYFYNSHGLEEKNGQGNTSTAYDMALLTKYAYQNKTFREIFGTKKYVVKTNYKTYSWTNKNRLLHSYEYTTGGKTGFTEKARRTLVTTASKNHINVVVVTLNDANDFADHKSLYETIFNNYEAVLVIDKNNFKIKNETKYKNDTLYILNDVYIPVTKEEKKDLKIKYELLNLKRYSDNDKVGTAKIYIGDNLVKEEAIYVDKTNKTKDNWWSKFWKWVKFW